MRTEQETDAIVGRTSLRDGAWHHIAVLFLGGKGSRPFVQVKQYVDGRLDGAGLLRRATGKNGTSAPGALVSIGRDPREEAAGADGFEGELDELLLADRPFTPDEIRRLMEENLPPGGT